MADETDREQRALAKAQRALERGVSPKLAPHIHELAMLAVEYEDAEAEVAAAEREQAKLRRAIAHLQ